MSKYMRLGVAAVVSASMVGLTACGESASDQDADLEKLVISGVPAEEGTSLSNTYQPVIDMLEDELDLEVEFQPSRDYAAVIEGQRTGNIHIAQYGPFAYYQAKQSGSDISILGAMLKEKGGEPGYQSYGFVPEDSDIESIEDFAGKTICFVDVGSTSGYLYPVGGLLEAGVEMDDWEQVETGGHDAAVIGVADGDCDAGFALDGMVTETAIDEGHIKEGDLRVVWESETIAEPPITVYNGLDEELITKLKTIWEEKANQDYLVENGYCKEGECDLTDQRIWGWTPVEDDYYDGLKEVCDATKVDACNAA
ncbi:MAG: phosphate/phosphite/phosphonate ABC transporter substrate-binding protein [Stackebrandtia sp.]